MRRFTKPFWFLLAVAFLCEAWIWRRTESFIERILRLVGWRHVKEKCEKLISGFSPYSALALLAAPALLIFPVKILGLWMVATGHWFYAIAILGVAKILSAGLTAFVFNISRERLLQIAWFNSLYLLVTRMLATARLMVEPYKEKIMRIRWFLDPSRRGSFFRHIIALRRRSKVKVVFHE